MPRPATQWPARDAILRFEMRIAPGALDRILPRRHRGRKDARCRAASGGPRPAPGPECARHRWLAFLAGLSLTTRNAPRLRGEVPAAALPNRCPASARFPEPVRHVQTGWARVECAATGS